jgi:predicted dehydrogenase
VREHSAVAAPEGVVPSRLPRLGFLGVGWIGRNRLEALESSGVAEVTAIADPAVDGALASYDELLEHDLDGVVIATPSAAHAEQAILALEHGLPVFCQKPLGRTAAETAAVVDAARDANRLLGVDFSYRHIAGVDAIRQLVREGVLGRIAALELVFHNAYGPDKAWFYDAGESGGGCVVDLGIHLIDLALWLLDWPTVERVDARVQHLHTETVEDYALAQLELGGAVSVRLACSWHLPLGRDAQIEARMFGTDAGAHLENVGGSFYDFVTYLVRDRDVQVLAQPPDEWGGRAAVAWARQLSASSAFDEDVEHAVDVARVIDAIYECAR